MLIPYLTATPPLQGACSALTPCQASAGVTLSLVKNHSESQVEPRHHGITTSQEQLASLATTQEVAEDVSVSVVSHSLQLLFYISFS